MQISRRIGRGLVAESKRNTSGILPESIYAFSVLDTRQHGDFTQISGRFHADFTQNRLRNRSGINAESYGNLSMPFPCLIPGNMKFSRRFHGDFTQNGLRNRSGIVAESKRNPSGILGNPSGISLILIRA